jgi:FMN-dependent oxidoreductase (nitrilotriacetate monooxygenase family)
MMPREIRVNAFASQTPVHLSPGLWRHPHDRSREFKTLRYWTELAQILEGGLFDGLFLADGIGINDVHGGSADSALLHGAQVPKHDPLLLISAMAHVTHHLGFGVTATVSFEPPALLARSFSTLDHLTKGRIGWNIVTGYYDSGAKAAGRASVTAHDERYEMAEEYMDLIYKLWEQSWEEGAVLNDRESGSYADPDKVHTISHHGKYFDLDSIHFTPPSPQRTPLLYQAGASRRGRAFAAKHAEAVFVAGPSKRVIAPIVADIRAQAERFGRDGRDIRFFTLMTVIVAETEAAARAKQAEYERYVSPEGVLTLFSGWTGIDFSRYPLDAPIVPSKVDAAVASMIESFTTADPDRVWTLRDLIAHNGIGGRGPVVVGSPKQVADELQAWVADTDVDGFNLSYAVTPESYSDFAAFVVPELQKRGAYKTSYPPGTLREKLSGGDRLLPASHPAARFRP